MRVFVAAAFLLLPVVIQADDQPAAQAVHADVPLLISDTSWNAPHGTAWRLNKTVAGQAREDRYVEFANLQDKEIAEIRLHVCRCGVKGSSWDAGWMTLKGPFSAHGSFKAIPSMPSGGSISQSISSSGFSGASVSNHLRITEVMVVDGDGSSYRYGSDVAKVLGGNISNFCANY